MSDQRDLDCCLFVARYKRVGVNQWIRIGKPDIETHDSAVAGSYRLPMVDDITEDGGRPTIRIRVFDERAVALESPDLLGDWRAAADLCDQALKNHFQGHVIVENLSEWS